MLKQKDEIPSVSLNESLFLSPNSKGESPEDTLLVMPGLNTSSGIDEKVIVSDIETSAGTSLPKKLSILGTQKNMLLELMKLYPESESKFSAELKRTINKIDEIQVELREVLSRDNIESQDSKLDNLNQRYNELLARKAVADSSTDLDSEIIPVSRGISELTYSIYIRDNGKLIIKSQEYNATVEAERKRINETPDESKYKLIAKQNWLALLTLPLFGMVAYAIYEVIKSKGFSATQYVLGSTQQNFDYMSVTFQDLYNTVDNYLPSKMYSIMAALAIAVLIASQALSYLFNRDLITRVHRTHIGLRNLEELHATHVQSTVSNALHIQDLQRQLLDRDLTIEMQGALIDKVAAELSNLKPQTSQQTEQKSGISSLNLNNSGLPSMIGFATPISFAASSHKIFKKISSSTISSIVDSSSWASMSSSGSSPSVSSSQSESLTSTASSSSSSMYSSSSSSSSLSVVGSTGT